MIENVFVMLSHPPPLFPIKILVTPLSTRLRRGRQTESVSMKIVRAISAKWPNNKI